MTFVRGTISENVFAQPPPTQTEAEALNRRRQSGDTEARDLLIRGSTRLVARAANKFGSYGVAMEDLFGAGMVGLTKAVDTFDHEKGPFVAWASWHVSIAIADELARIRYMVALPRRACTDLFEVNRAISSMKTVEGGSPSLGAISTKTGLPRGRVLSLMTIDRTPVALDALPPGASTSQDTSETLRLGDVVADSSGQHPGEEIDRKEKFESLRRHVADLEPKRRTVIELNFGMNGPALNHREIAVVLKLSPRRISQLAQAAISQLRGQVAA